MLDEYEDEIICDLAETYHIFNYKELSPLMVATFVFGLKTDSRLKMKMRGESISLDTYLKAQMTDALNLILWTKTKDAEKGRNQPKSILDHLLGRDNTDLISFDDSNDFENYRKKIINGN